MNKSKFVFRGILFVLFNLFLTSISYAQVIESDVLISGEILSFNEKSLEIRFTIKNNGSESIFIATNPTTVTGKKGYYLVLDGTDSSFVKISSSVHLPPPYFPITDARGVELKKLLSGEIYVDTISIKFPSKETDPPFFKKESKRKTIVSKEINRFELTIGYFVEEKGILDFLKLKPNGWFIQGSERFMSGENKGKSFLEIQRLASFSKTLLRNES